MQVVHTGEPFPARVTRSVFLAGPTPRSEDVASWRPQALAALEAAGWDDGAVFVPEDRPGRRRPGELCDADYARQVAWERDGLARADAILCWVPRDMTTMPGLTTNVEVGLWATSGKLVLGLPPGAQHVRYLGSLADAERIPVATTLAAAVAAVVALVGPPLAREGGAAQVPLHVFRSPAFQRWYTAQTAAGNRLLGARVAFTLRTGPDRAWLFCAAVQVDVHVAAEGRRKTNEVVLARPDVAAVVLVRRDAQDPRRSLVGLVREFRSASSTSDGYVREPPSGSSFDSARPIDQVARDEVREETGLVLAADRLRPLGARQVAATLLTHAAHAWVVDLTQDEVDTLRAGAGVVHGADACERTWVELWTVDDLLRRPVLDWSSLGMVLAAVS